MAVSGSFPIFLRRSSVTLRPDKGAGLVPFFNFPWLNRSSEKWLAISGADLVRSVPCVERMGLFSVTVLDRYKRC